MKTLVVLLALSLSAFAGSINYDTGKFTSGKLTGSFKSHLFIEIFGSLNQVVFQTGTLTPLPGGCPFGGLCFTFNNGSINVDNGLFQDGLNGGLVIGKNGIITISALLLPKKGLIANGAVSATFTVHNHKILSGSGDVVVNPAPLPEPTALEEIALGLGILGLVVAASKVRTRRIQPATL